MKVAMVTPRYTKDIRGGGERSCKLLVETLQSVGVDITVLSGDELFPNVKSKEKLNIVMHKYLKKHINEYDIFHTYNMSLLPAIGMLTKRYGINSIGTLNGHVYSPAFAKRYSTNKNYLTNIAIALTAIRHIKKFTTLSQYYTDTWVNDKFDKDKFTVITNMIEPNYIPANEKSTKILNVLFVGNYAPWRNLDMLLKAFSQLPEQEVTLQVVGSGWQDKFITMNSNNWIHYVPQVPHKVLNQMYARAAIYIQPYDHFGVGRAMLEAGQNKTAILTTGREIDFPHLSKTINFFSDSHELQMKLQRMIHLKAIRKAKQKDIKNIVNKYYTPEVIAKQYIKLYEEIIKC